MKRLYIVRHSKAGHITKNILNDHARNLTQKGRDLCIPIARYINATGKEPSIIHTSYANRTLETANVIAEHLTSRPIINDVQKLYLADSETIFNYLREIDNSVECAMLVGHNPGLHQFAMDFAGSGDVDIFRNMKNNFPTPSIAVFEFFGTWLDIEHQEGKLRDFKTAKELS